MRRSLLVLALIAPALAAATTPEDWKRLDELTQARRASAAGPTYAVHCRPPAAPKPAAARRASPVAFPFKLDRPSHYLQNILALLKLTRSGRAKVEQFEAGRAAGDYVISSTQLSGVFRCPSGARACYYADTRTMFVNQETELGSLAPTVFHEICHAVDSEFADAIRKLKSLARDLDSRFADALRKGLPLTASVELSVRIREANEIATFRTERAAYDHAFEVLEELGAMFPDYYRRHRAINPGDDRLIAAYHLTPSTVARFRRGECETLP